MRRQLDETSERLTETSERLAESVEASKRATERAERAEREGMELNEAIDKLRQNAELERYRAVAAETRKGEEREARLVRRIEEFERSYRARDVDGFGGLQTGEQQGTAATLDMRHTDRYVQVCVTGEVSSDKHTGVTDTGGVCGEPSQSSASARSSVSSNLRATEFTPLSTPPRIVNTHGEVVVPVPTLAAAPLDALSMTMLAQHLPPLPNFAGDETDGDGETIEEWLERLELVANACCWNDQTKLVNVATRLRGSASRFYRTCSPQQRSTYVALTAALKQRFTPVRLQAVQSSRFHERKQGSEESVDSYAQL